MISFFTKVFKDRMTLVLIAMSIFSIALSIARLAFTNNTMFRSMNWNLFLAFLPWLLSAILYYNSIRNKIGIIAIILCWIAFFPNAPYVLTDLIHLGEDHSAPLWYDLTLLLSYGLCGLLYGFVSLQLLEAMISEYLSRIKITIISILLIYISCFGIYLGRFLRWNSWDLVTNLTEVMKDIVYRIIYPFQHPTAWAFTLLFGTLLNLLYWSYKSFNRQTSVSEPR